MKFKTIAEDKDNFRQSKIWREFREYVKYNQVLDPLSMERLDESFHLHHLDLNDENYRKLLEENFMGLNQNSHNCVHFLYSLGNWKNALLVLEEILTRMDELNKKNETTRFNEKIS